MLNTIKQWIKVGFMEKIEIIALEALKILLPEVQEKKIIGVNKKTYDLMVKDAFYVARVFEAESNKLKSKM